MDSKLYLKILISEGLLICLASLLIAYLIKGAEIDFDLFFWSLFVIIFSAFNYFDYASKGKEIGIQKGDKNYLKTTYECSIQSDLNSDKLIEHIQNTNKYLGKVKINGKVIRGQSFKGINRMSKSDIQIEQTEKGQNISLLTRPYFKFILIDSHINYKCFNLLKSLVLITDA